MLARSSPRPHNSELTHPEIAMALWCLIIVGVCAPLAPLRFNRTLAG
jgi:hypothetical protein